MVKSAYYFDDLIENVSEHTGFGLACDVWTQVADGRQPMQVQQRQHLAELRGLTCPGRQDCRGKPLAFNGLRIDPAVVDPRRFHRNGAGDRQDLAGLLVAVADDQPLTAPVELVSELSHIGDDLGLQRRGQYLPGTVADDLIQQDEDEE